jgi:hypothetical protein
MLLSLETPDNSTGYPPTYGPDVAADGSQSPREERWLPVNVSFDGAAPNVRWLDFGAKRISEPIFHQTLRVLRSQSPPPGERSTSLAGLLKLAKETDEVRPAGIIFHISRCGSTLVANGLRAGENVAVLSEATPVESLFRANLFANSEIPDADRTETRRVALDAVVRLFARDIVGRKGARVIIKCHVIDMLQIPLIRSIWPETPSLVMIRDPLEVVVSNLVQPGSWCGLQSSLQNYARIFGPSALNVATMSKAEFYACCIGRFLEAGLNAVSDRCKVVDYADLGPQTLRSIAVRFGIRLPHDGDARLQRAWGTYSKDPAALRRFETDGDRKRADASQDAIEAVRRHAEDKYCEIRALEKR